MTIVTTFLVPGQLNIEYRSELGMLLFKSIEQVWQTIGNSYGINYWKLSAELFAVPEDIIVLAEFTSDLPVGYA